MKKKLNFLEKAAKDLFPINRSLTGDGNRFTLNYLKKNFNNKIKILNVGSGETCFDWSIPNEWNVKNACLKDQNNKIICNFSRNNLELMGYSIPINKWFTFKEIKKNLFFLKNKPNSIPYVTSYYSKNWGFCLTYNRYKKLNKKNKYKVEINSTLKKGKLNYGELEIKGTSKKTILLTTYICHPSLAINELSGLLCLGYLSKIIKKKKYTIKILFIPETVGAIYYIKKNFESLKKNLVAGINLTCVGLKGPLTKISSIYNNTYIDHIFDRVGKKYKNYRSLSFLKRGSNERQFGCQNLNLPFVTFCRVRFSDYKEYHTSDDNLKILNYEEIFKSAKFIAKVINEIANNNIYVKKKFCEPFLTKYKLLNPVSTKKSMASKERNIISNIIAYINTNVDEVQLSKILNISLKKVKKIIHKIYKLGIVKKYI
jgi:aminopeptidase-like protein